MSSHERQTMTAEELKALLRANGNDLRKSRLPTAEVMHSPEVQAQIDELLTMLDMLQTDIGVMARMATKFLNAASSLKIFGKPRRAHGRRF